MSLWILSCSWIETKLTVAGVTDRYKYKSSPGLGLDNWGGFMKYLKLLKCLMTLLGPLELLRLLRVLNNGKQRHPSLRGICLVQRFDLLVVVPPYRSWMLYVEDSLDLLGIDVDPNPMDHQL